MLWGGPVVIIVFILFWLIYVLRNLTEGFTQKILESGTKKLILIQFKKFPKIELEDDNTPLLILDLKNFDKKVVYLMGYNELDN